MPLGRSSGSARVTCVSLLLLALTGCAAKIPAAPPTAPEPPPVSLDQKVAWVLRLEQQRRLRDTEVPAPNGPIDRGPTSGTLLRQARVADLEALARDPEPSVRSRAALAIGRIGQTAGRATLERALADGDASVRASAAFGLGLLGDKAAAPSLHTLLGDPAPDVRIRAIEAIGLLGDRASADVVASTASGCPAVIAPIDPDDESWPRAAEVEICRTALFALVRTGSFDALARVALDGAGQPVSSWWPVAYALQRIGDPRAVPALRTLLASRGVYTPAFALRGLMAQKDTASLPAAQALAMTRSAPIGARAAAIRAWGALGGRAAAGGLAALLNEPALPTSLLVEVAGALGATAAPAAFEPLVDLFVHPAAVVRSAAQAAAAKVDPDGFLIVLAGLGLDRDWSVRASLAATLATLPSARVTDALDALAEDTDVRVQGPALEALAAVKAPDIVTRLLKALEASDFAVRATAASLIGDLKPAGGAAALVAAYERGLPDSAFEARAAALEGLAQYGAEGERVVLRRALGDPDWAVRWRAAELLRGLGETAEPQVPAPLRESEEMFASPQVLRPTYSPHAFIETSRGTIELQLNVVESTMTSRTFAELARRGLFNGIRIHRVVPGFVVQAGDPRGDGEGGPGFTQRDELSALPFVRGTVGMALNWRDTAGSQWFITLGPQPHLDGRYTVFGRVVAGWDVLDLLNVGDTIERVRIWDGVDFR